MGDRNNMDKHFSSIAATYRKLRTTDVDQILYIRDQVKGLERVDAADFGCGDGRYDLLLFQNIPNLHLICVDKNEKMLGEAARLLESNGIKNFRTIACGVEDLSLEASSLDFVFTSNAVHHFDLSVFLATTAQFLKVGGLLFIYTRLPSQNAHNIWGRYFPNFTEKETRLPEFPEMEESIGRADGLKIEDVMTFRHERLSSLERLLERARNRHYSTFELYAPGEFEAAIKQFEANIRNAFDDPEKVHWHDENLMLMARRSGSSLS